MKTGTILKIVCVGWFIVTSVGLALSINMVLIWISLILNAALGIYIIATDPLGPSDF